MTNNLDNKMREALFEYLLRLGDDRLILGHRLSEWCGHAPILEEDIALGNIALDLRKNQLKKINITHATANIGFYVWATEQKKAAIKFKQRLMICGDSQESFLKKRKLMKF